MKNLTYLLTFLLLSSCIENNKYSLTGTFSGEQNEEWIYLTKVPGDYSSRDSAKIKNGTFKFEGIVEYPEMYAFHYQMDRITGMAFIVMEPGVINIEINPDNWDLLTNVTGGKLNMEYNDFKAGLYQKYLNPQDELYSRLRKAEPDKKQVLKDSMKLLNEENYKAQIDFIKTHPESPASLYVMASLSSNISLEEKGKILEKVNPEIQNTLFYKELFKDYETQVEVKENPLGIDFGHNAELMNIEYEKDSIIKTLLKTNPGKVLYIDIWATWCGPCRDEFPHSKKLFTEIDPEKIQMIYFCTRSNKEEWKKTIEELELPGQHYLIGDETFKQFESDYGIVMSGIPHYMIVGKDGKIKYNDAPRPSSDETLKILTALIE